MNTTSAYTLAICELYNPLMHGSTVDSSPDINGQYLVHSTYNMDEFMHDEWIDILDMMKTYYTKYPNYKQHDYIRNYKKLVENDQYYKLDIVYMIELGGGETVGVIKTNGLKRLQRIYKRKLIEKNKK